jgi:hypothetical protein
MFVDDDVGWAGGHATFINCFQNLITPCTKARAEFGQCRLKILVGLTTAHLPPTTETTRETHDDVEACQLTRQK